jgi:hypothetical protein
MRMTSLFAFLGAGENEFYLLRAIFFSLLWVGHSTSFQIYT